MPRKQRSQRAAAAAAQNKIKEAVKEFDKPIEGRPFRKLIRKSRGQAKVGCATTNADTGAAKPLPNGSSSRFHEMQFQDLGSLSCLTHSDGNFSLESLVCHSDSATGKQIAHLERLQRRAQREINSNGPMRLSGRTRYRMTSGYASTPVYSPIVAETLSFTPIATPSCFQHPASTRKT